MRRFWAHGVPISDLYMMSEAVGWDVTAQGEPTVGQGFLLHTVDGGKSWKAVTLPEALLGQDVRVYVFDEQMVFLQPFQKAGAGTAYLYFYRTTDGGMTWQRSNWPTTQPERTANSIQTSAWTFLDHLHGWVVTPLPDPSMTRGGSARTPFSGTGETLFQTSDGGQSWQLLAHLPVKYVSANLNYMDMQTGWFSTSIVDPKYPDPTDPNAFKAVLYVTHDGGRSWKQAATLPLPAQEHAGPMQINEMSFTQQQGYFIASFVSTQYLYMTQDGGKTWRIDGAALPANGFYDVLDATHVADGAGVYALTNGQWKQTGNAPLAPNGVYGHIIEFLSAQIGIATLAHDNSIYESHDGGQKWQKVGSVPSA